MKVLFICSGNSKDRINPVVKIQGDTLRQNGIDVEYFTIKGNGIRGYIKNIYILRQYLKNKYYDIVHAHYSLSGMVASLAGSRPLVVSLMGSDVRLNFFLKIIFNMFKKLYWRNVIVKSEYLKKKSKIRNAKVIPNGVELDRFKKVNKKIAQEKIGFDPNKKHIVFVANPDRSEKNFILAKEAFSLLDEKEVELNVVFDVPYEKIPYYLYAADVLLLTSLWEGSPNVVKEAMVCGLPIVSTDVGDVRKLIGKTEGCYITSFEPEDVKKKIEKSLEFGKRTKGIKNISHLDSNKIAQDIIEIYHQVIKN